MANSRRMLSAIGSVMDILPSHSYRSYGSSQTTDALNLSRDWNAIGGDMQRAINKYDRESYRK